MAPEAVSIVVLTKDEAVHLPDCLDALLAQRGPEDEVLVIDAASVDGTQEVAQRYEAKHPNVVRAVAADETISFGAARNLAVSLARHEVVVFVSADAPPEPGWLEAMRRALGNADIVYGRQRHAPTRTNVATVARGLRYWRFESGRDALPEAYASHVNAAYRKLVFDELRFDEELSGMVDLAFAREARFAGYRITYARGAVVRHKDVTSWRGEWRKNLREGRVQAELRSMLGAPVGHLAWACAVGGLAVIAVFLQSVLALVGMAAMFFAPTLRRLASPLARNYRPGRLMAGAAAAPVFDVAFIAGYLRRRVSR